VSKGRLIRLLVWILIGLALRAVALRGDGLWMDEGYTAWTAHLRGAEHVAAVRNDDAPPLYYALQRAILPHLPPNEASVRLLSVVAGVAGVCWLAAAPPVAGLIEGPVACYAIGTYGVYYGRQARSYALLILWGLILMTATARALRGERRWLIVVALVEGLALWTHNVAAMLVVGANLAWLLCGRRDPRGWFAAQAGALLIWIPYLAWILPEQLAMHAAYNTWIEPFWKKVPLVFGPFLSLGCFTSGARVEPLPHAERWYYPGPGSMAMSLAAHAAVLTLLVAAFRRNQHREALFAAAFTLGPLFALAGLSMVGTPAYTVGRTDAIGYAGFVVWAALGFRALPRSGRGIVAGVLLLSTVLAVTTRAPFAGHRREHDRTIGRTLRRMVGPGDWVAFVGPSRPSIDYYLSDGRPGRADAPFRRVQFPASFARNPAADYPALADSLRTYESEARKIRDRFEATAGPGATFWCVVPMHPGRAPNPTASDLPYPGAILAYAVNGLRPLHPIERLRGDEMGVDWLLFGVRRGSLIPRDELQPVQAEP
jgi:hypothetical protein